jgi:hypothetical protein
LSILKSKTSQISGSQEKLEVFIYVCLLFFEKNHDFFRIFVQEESRWSIKDRIARSAILRKRKDFFIDLIKEAQQEGLIRKDIEAMQISYLLESIISSFVFFYWEEGSQQGKDLKAAAGIIRDLFLSGAKKR